MNAREKLEAELAQAHADRDKASAVRNSIGTDWRKNSDPGASLDLYRSNWSKAEAEWNRANALVEKLSASLAALERAEEVARARAALEGALAEAGSERDRANAALAAIAKARAEREKNIENAPARVERRGNAADRRKPAADRRKSVANRHKAESRSSGVDSSASVWAEAVANYNKADAAWNRARAALTELNRTGGKR